MLFEGESYTVKSLVHAVSASLLMQHQRLVAVLFW